ncbi:MAG: InlB B-repeat-containing protein [Candidatus Methanomethylophilaceae archaeon]|nr:InlB B-repeat-containing protein [Candidatus Methanomethylophilaceae archaeon]
MNQTKVASVVALLAMALALVVMAGIMGSSADDSGGAAEGVGTGDGITVYVDSTRGIAKILLDNPPDKDVDVIYFDADQKQRMVAPVPSASKIYIYVKNIVPNEMGYPFLVRSHADQTTVASCTVFFNQDICTISFDANGGTGTMEPISVAAGGIVTLPNCTFSAPTGKAFSAWLVGGIERAVGYSFTPAGDTTVKAVWKPVYTVSFSPNGGTGTMPSISVDQGSSITLPANGFTAPAGKQFKRWLIGSTEYDVGASFTPSANTLVKASWESGPAISYKLQFNANGGSGAPDNLQYSGPETSHGFTIPQTTPTRSGYTFLGWADTPSATAGKYQPGGTLTLQSSSPTKTIYAVWQGGVPPGPTPPAPGTKYAITVAQTTGGTVTASASSAEQGTTIRVSAVADQGYRFLRWDASVAIEPTVTASFTMPAKDVTVKAVFEPITYTVTLTAGDGGRVSGAGSYPADTTVTITATPKAGHSFVKWESSGKSVSTDAVYTFKITGDVSFKAYFSKDDPVESIIDNGDGTFTERIYDVDEDDKGVITETLKDTTTGPSGTLLSEAETTRTIVLDEKGDISSIKVVSEIEEGSVKKTITAEGDQDEVVVSIGSSDHATVREAIRAMDGVGSDEFTIYRSSADGTISLSKESVQMIASEGYQISVGSGKQSVTLDAASVKGIGDEMVLTVVVAEADDLTPAQRSTIGSNYAVEVTLTVNGVVVHTLAGKANIMIGPGYDVAFVYYVSDDGSVEEIPSEYDKGTGEVSFYVTHFSIYMVTKEKYEPSGSGGGLDPLLIGIFVVILLMLIAALAYYLWASKRRTEE